MAKSSSTGSGGSGTGASRGRRRNGGGTGGGPAAEPAGAPLEDGLRVLGNRSVAVHGGLHGQSDGPIERHVACATSMSDTERAQQMSGHSAKRVRQLQRLQPGGQLARGIRGWYFRDGPRGVEPERHGDGKKDFSTAFPVAIGRGASFDVDLEYKVGQAIGDEMLASGNTMMLAPTVNILRHPAWGRSQETYGEDSFLLGRLGSAFVMGLQKYVAACVKHYAANNIEDGRGRRTPVIDAQTLREKYGRHYEMIVEEGGAAFGDGGLQPGQRHALDAEQRASDRHAAHRVRVPGIRADRLVGDERQQRARAAATRAAPPIRWSKSAVDAGLDMELPWRYNFLELPNLVDLRRPAGRAAHHVDGANSRAEVPVPRRQDQRLRAQAGVHDLRLEQLDPEQRPDGSGHRSQPYPAGRAGGRGGDGAAQE